MTPRQFVHDPRCMMRLHAVMFWLWLAAGVALTGWAFYDPDNRYLLALVVFMSAYANAAGHAAGYSGAAPSAREGAG